MSIPPTSTNGYSRLPYDVHPPGNFDDVPFHWNSQRLGDASRPSTPVRSAQDGPDASLISRLDGFTSLAGPCEWGDAISPSSTFPALVPQDADFLFSPSLGHDDPAGWQSLAASPYIPTILEQSFAYNYDAAPGLTDATAVPFREDAVFPQLFGRPQQTLSYAAAAAAAAAPPQQQHLSSIAPPAQLQQLVSAAAGHANNERTRAALPPSAAADHEFGILKRPLSYAEALTANLTSQPSPSTLHQQPHTARPKLVVQTGQCQPKRCSITCASRSCQCRVAKRPKVKPVRPSPSRAQGPTSAPAIWLDGMRDNLNYQLGQSALGPRVSDWNQAPRLPGDRNSSAPSPSFLHPPRTPVAASPTTSSIASSTRTPSKRTRKEMSIGPYQCWCHKGFPTSNALSHHKRYHATGPHPYVCTVCTKDFLHDKDLQRHIATHDNSPSSRFFCHFPACHGHGGYARKDHLQRHMRAKHAVGAADSVIQGPDSMSSPSEEWSYDPGFW